MTLLPLLEVSYNQPKFTACATWAPDGITLADSSTLGITANGLFVTTDNSVYATAISRNSVLVWPQGRLNATHSIFTNLTRPYRIFVTTNGDVYVDNEGLNQRVEKWAKNATNSTITMLYSGLCNGLFVDIYDSLYCSLWSNHRVVRRTVDSDANTSITVAGNGSNGSASSMFQNPCGIFVDIDLSLYVADHGNSRVQLFRSGQLNGTTVAGNGAPDTISLSGPASAVLDGNGYLFIADHNNFRIVGSSPNGFRCIAGCTEKNGSAANQFFKPYDLTFDSHGNLFVTDMYNNRLQKFILAKNSCGEFPKVYRCVRAVASPSDPS